MIFEAFINELKEVKGLEELAPNANGCYALRINNEYIINFSISFDRQDFFLYASLGNIPLSEKEQLELYDMLLDANLFGKELGHSYFSLDKSMHQILLINRTPISILSKENFIDELQKFAVHLKRWKHIVETLPLKVKSQPVQKEGLLYFKL